MKKTEEQEIRRKLKILNYAKEIGNVSKTCRYWGVSRDTFYRWKRDYRAKGEKGLINSKPCPAGGNEHILHVINITPHPVAGEVAGRVIREARPRHAAILVEAVRDIGVGFLILRLPLVQRQIDPTIHDLAGQLIDTVEAVAPVHIIGRPRQIMAEGLQRIILMIAVTGHRAIAEGHARPAAGRVIGIVSQQPRAILLNDIHPVHHFIGVARIKTIGPLDLCPVNLVGIGVTQCPAIVVGRGQLPGRVRLPLKYGSITGRTDGQGIILNIFKEQNNKARLTRARILN